MHSDARHEAQALVNALTARSETAREGIERAVRLCPLDPLMGPILSVRALSVLIHERPGESADEAAVSVRAGPSHVIDVMQAAANCVLGGMSHPKATKHP